jgi:hypothetical protein
MNIHIYAVSIVTRVIDIVAASKLNPSEIFATSSKVTTRCEEQ